MHPAVSVIFQLRFLIFRDNSVRIKYFTCLLVLFLAFLSQTPVFAQNNNAGGSDKIKITPDMLQAIIQQARVAALANHKKCPELSESIKNCRQYSCSINVPIVNQVVNIRVAGKVNKNTCRYYQGSTSGDTHVCELDRVTRYQVANSYKNFLEKGDFNIAAMKQIESSLKSKCKKVVR